MYFLGQHLSLGQMLPMYRTSKGETIINMYYKIPCNSRVHRLPVYVLDWNKDTVRKEARRPVS